MIRTRLQGDTPFFPNMLNNGNIEVCLKEDVDKVIAELKDDVTYWKKVAKKNMDDNVAMASEREKAFKSERHNKYKRCLAMAYLCGVIVDWDMEIYGGTGNEIRAIFCSKWRKRWLKLAEQFKEAK